MSKIIKNSEFLRNRIERCLDQPDRPDEARAVLSRQKMQMYMNEECVDLEFIKNFKVVWNTHFPSKSLCAYLINDQSF